MNRIKLFNFYLLMMSFLFTACGDDKYYYPSVKLEFVTVNAGEDGFITSLLPDKGELLMVSKDKTASTLSPNTSRRVISNYEITSTGGTSTAQIYSIQSVVAPEPKVPNDPAFAEGLKYDPVEISSIWMGRAYLNMILNVKVNINSDKQHIFGMIEENVEEATNEKVVTLSLYHNANGDEENYNRRAYISVPLSKYINTEKPNQILRIKFKFHTYGQNGMIVESTKYAEPGFEYVQAETE